MFERFMNKVVAIAPRWVHFLLSDKMPAEHAQQNANAVPTGTIAPRPFVALVAVSLFGHVRECEGRGKTATYRAVSTSFQDRITASSRLCS
jgi:hypothetical protein